MTKGTPLSYRKYGKMQQVLWSLSSELYRESQKIQESLPDTFPPDGTQEQCLYMVNWSKADTFEAMSCLLEEVNSVFHSNYLPSEDEDDDYENLQELWNSREKRHFKRKQKWLSRVLRDHEPKKHWSEREELT